MVSESCLSSPSHREEYVSEGVMTPRNLPAGLPACTRRLRKKSEDQKDQTDTDRQIDRQTDRQEGTRPEDVSLILGPSKPVHLWPFPSDVM